MTFGRIVATSVVLVTVVVLALSVADMSVGLLDLCKIGLGTGLIARNAADSGRPHSLWGLTLPMAVAAGAFAVTNLTSAYALGRSGLQSYADGMAAYVVGYVAIRAIDWIRRN